VVDQEAGRELLEEIIEERMIFSASAFLFFLRISAKKCNRYCFLVAAGA
jgi:hypothetical protein